MRPGERWVSTVQFAAEESCTMTIQRKPFCSRKTPPTLESLTNDMYNTKKQTKINLVCFFWRKVRDSPFEHGARLKAKT